MTCELPSFVRRGLCDYGDIMWFPTLSDECSAFAVYGDAEAECSSDNAGNLPRGSFTHATINFSSFALTISLL